MNVTQVNRGRLVSVPRRCQAHIMFGVKFTSCLNIDIIHKYPNPIPPTNPYPFSTLLYILDYSPNPLSFLLHSLPFLFTHRTALHSLAQPCTALHSLSAQPCIASHSLAQPCTASHSFYCPFIVSRLLGAETPVEYKREAESRTEGNSTNHQSQPNNQLPSASTFPFLDLLVSAYIAIQDYLLLAL